MNEYMKERYKRRRIQAIEYLGGVCTICGIDSDLEFDHKDPETKICTIAKASSFSEKRFWEEVNKCQLLCKEHYKEKSTKEIRKRRNGSEELMHGREHTYLRYGCRCGLCRDVMSAARKRYRNRNRNKTS